MFFAGGVCFRISRNAFEDLSWMMEKGESNQSGSVLLDSTNGYQARK
jgi:hypothetical protein